MVSSISRSIPSPAPRAPPPHYQTFLTPILHRRFVRSCAVGIIVCYVEAFFISNKSSFLWTLFPLSSTGFKTLVLFFCTAVPVLILRVSQLHVGVRANPSGFHTFKRSVGSFGTYSTILTYVFASLVFISLYLLSSTKGDKLSFIVDGKTYERPRLNERFIYLVYSASHVGLVQGILHIYRDRGRLEFPDVNVPPNEALKARIPVIVKDALTLALITLTFFWLNRSSSVPSWPIDTIFRNLWVAFLLGCIWESVHTAFSIYFSEEPIKDGKAISEKSPDPNGTLVSGLRATGLLTQVMAFSELVFISHNSPARRKSIFTDVDRKPTNIWEQIMKECLVVIEDVDSKLTGVGRAANGPLPKIASTHSTALALKSPSPAIQFIAGDTALLTSPSTSSGKLLDLIQSKDSANSSLSNIIRKLPPSMAEAEASVTGSFKSRIEPFLASPYGQPFRQTIQQRTSILMPNVRIQVNAVSSLARLVTASLSEDDYGVVQKHVPLILQAFSSTIEALDRYMASPPIHWTDIEAKSDPKSLTLREPEMLLKALEGGLRDIAVAFKPYVKDMELSAEVKRRVLEAKEEALL
ncbi:uncharacterized protein H6S33_001263 [Morchella sextelata]|uniref:uncharacterized protein n=1 Tax=Morchella sextelata TaxID=1174677 RepID=UPI001D040BFF|nr:uncharacterized protein H6S33_001263 [Morchella sextelata]KAH0609035.1 hypothetical protein H6S33_001263 [Morchella sextelata]